MISLTILALCAFVAVAKCQVVDLQSHYATFNSSVLHVDNYLSAHHRQHLANIWFYNFQIETFKTLYTERIKTISIQQNALMDTLIETYNRLYPLELLSDTNKDCIQKYKTLIPPVSAVKYNIDSCISVANSQLNSLISSPSATNRTLDSYYLNTFERAVQSCRKNNPALDAKYTLCAENAVSAANVYTINNQKTFATQMDSSASSADVYVKKAMDCNFAIQNSTIASIAQANILIDRCNQGLDNCNRSTGYSCDYVYHIPSSSIDNTKLTMKNVFYGSNENVKCLMLDVY